MLTKYASFEGAQVIDLKGSATRARHASLNKLSEFEDYRTEDGYLYARIRAISSRVNKNHDGWPSIELAGGREVFDRHTASEGGFTVEASRDSEYGFSTFLGKPIFVDHNNSNPDRARGVIVDAKLHVDDHRTASLDPYYSSDDCDPEHVPATWVELLLEVDAKSFPKLAKAIIEGAKDSGKGIDGFSMGCDVERSRCSICKKEASAPDDFCNHIKMKGAYFDSVDRDGRKTSKRAYENCYGVRFFEISAVFDPADETALIREVKSSVNKEASTKLAENPLPQADLSHAPSDVDTLRKEQICPVCGSSMDNETCEICGHIEPPDGFGNPDLDKAQESDDLVERAPDDQPTPDPNDQMQGGISAIDANGDGNSPMNPGLVAHVTGDMAWDISLSNPKTAAINPAERPVLPGNPPVTDEPRDQVLQDQTRPVTSSVRTASDFIAVADATRRTTMNHTADAAATVAKPDVNVDVVGVGGVDQASNEEASQAEAQVDVTAVGGTGVEGVSADSTSNVDKGNEHSKNIEGTPTDTWSGTDGQTDPVTNEPYPASADGVKASSWIVHAYEDGTGVDDGHNGDSSAVKGVKPIAEQFGERVDLLQAVTSPENNSGRTDTWSGTDGNGVTKQQDPVSPESISHGESGLEGGGVYDSSPAKSSAHIFASMQVAELEQELGLSTKDKYARAAELEVQAPAKVTTILATLKQVRTAGLSKSRTAGAKKLPVLSRGNAVKEASVEASEPKGDDSFLFGA